ncbi:MAG: efflux transporter outer membrane subunit [Pseudomonas sp.]
MLTNKPCLILLASLGLSACSINAPLPQAQIAAPASWSQEVTHPQWPEQQWWLGYQSAELETLLQRARAGNLDLATAASRLQQADAQLRQTGAALLPQLDGRVSANRSGADGSDPGSSYAASLSTSYEVDFWGRNRSLRDSSAANLQASRFDQVTLAISIEAAVVSTWLQILENQQRLQLANDSLANAERVLELVEARYRFGAADRLQLSQQRTLVAQLRAGLPSLEQNRLQLRNSLALLLGQTPDAELPQGSGLEGSSLEGSGLEKLQIPSIGAGLPSELLERRPDIRASEARLLAANADLGAARAALYPSIQLTAQLGAQSLALSSLVSNPATSWNLAAGLVQPIFQGGRLRAQVDLSEARQEELLIDYRRTLLGAFGEVDTALGAVRQAEQRYLFLQTASELAEEAFRLAEARYRAGSIDLQTLLDTQRTWYQSQDSLTQQRAAWLIATIDLYRALGGGWQDEQGVYTDDPLG